MAVFIWDGWQSLDQAAPVPLWDLLSLASPWNAAALQQPWHGLGTRSMLLPDPFFPPFSFFFSHCQPPDRPPDQHHRNLPLLVLTGGILAAPGSCGNKAASALGSPGLVALVGNGNLYVLSF